MSSEATDTPVVAVTATATATPVEATAALMAAAAAAKTPLPAATRLPETGFAEVVGLPGMAAIAAGLLLLIALARWQRASVIG